MTRATSVMHFRDSGGWCPFVMRHPDSPAIVSSMDAVTCKTCQRSFQAAHKKADRPFQVGQDLIYVSGTPDSEKVKWKVICVRPIETDIQAPNGLITTITREAVPCWRHWRPTATDTESHSGPSSGKVQL